MASRAPLSPSELASPDAVPRPLCVKLSGGLVRSDLVWESALRVARKEPHLAFALPFWLLGGKAAFGRKVLALAPCDATVLPYRSELVELLREAAGSGRKVLLVTAEDAPAAAAVVEHLPFLHGQVSVATGEPVSRALAAGTGTEAFDYVGDSAADLLVTRAPGKTYLVGAGPTAAAAAAARGDTASVLSTRPPRLRAFVKVARPHQWAKNALVVVPLLLAPGLPSARQLVSAVIAAGAFSLCASAGYVFNDLLDVEADRAHQTKRKRPFASGDLPIAFGLPLFVALLAVSFGTAAATLPLGFLGMLAAYFVATMSYSLVLKSKLMVDVVVLAMLYTHRVTSGGIATGIHISAWLLAFSMFMFVSLALAKRYIELKQSLASGGKLKSRGYHTQDLEMVAAMGPSAGYIAVLVFCLFVDSSAVASRYRDPMLLWFVAPLLLYWISRVWFLAHRGQMQDDPVKFALNDRHSWVVAVLVAVIAATARFFPR